MTTPAIPRRPFSSSPWKMPTRLPTTLTSRFTGVRRRTRKFPTPTLPIRGRWRFPDLIHGTRVGITTRDTPYPSREEFGARRDCIEMPMRFFFPSTGAIACITNPKAQLYRPCQPWMSSRALLPRRTPM